MQVYHGSYTAIKEVDLSKCQANKDFGRGFYVTKFRQQAESWAKIIGKMHHTEGVVTEFTFLERAFAEKSLNVLRFTEYNEAWFDFVMLNRDTSITETRHQYDIIEGPVADDRVQRRIDKYLAGEITREDFFRQLIHDEPSHQICFCTLNSLRMLTKERDKVIFKVEDIAELIVEQLMMDQQVNEMQATDLFYSSATFTRLADSATKLYEKDWTEIYEMLLKEIQK